MSQGFKLKYDQLQESNPTSPKSGSDSSAKAEDHTYAEIGHTRNICFVWLDGKRLFLNYSYLVSGEYAPDENTITLIFTSQTTILIGINLGGLFYAIMNQLVKQVICHDARYNQVTEDSQPLVNQIILQKQS